MPTATRGEGLALLAGELVGCVEAHLGGFVIHSFGAGGEDGHEGSVGS